MKKKYALLQLLICLTSTVAFSQFEKDLSFANNGDFKFDNSVWHNSINGIFFNLEDFEELPTGEILLLSNNMNVLKLKPDGTLDTSFSGDGIYEATFPYNVNGKDLIITPDNKILVAGKGGVTNSFGTNKGILIRLNADGTLDNTFQDNGSLVIQTATNNESINNMIIVGSNLYLAYYKGDALFSARAYARL